MREQKPAKPHRDLSGPRARRVKYRGTRALAGIPVLSRGRVDRRSQVPENNGRLEVSRHLILFVQ